MKVHLPQYLQEDHSVITRILRFQRNMCQGRDTQISSLSFDKVFLAFMDKMC